MPSVPTILVADLLPIFRDVATLTLAPLARIVAAIDDEHALERIRRDPPRLILAHYPPPYASGPSLCEAVKADATLAHIPVILVTSGDRPADHADAVRTGADDVLTKPFDRVSLLAAVRRLLDVPVVRGLPRVAVDTPVRFAHEGAEGWGVARNLSRGGIFVESEQAYPLGTEVRIEFPLPGREKVLAPGATVVWARLPTGPTTGLGLRFLGLDGASARTLEHYVHEHRGVAEPYPQSEVPS